MTVPLSYLLFELSGFLMLAVCAIFRIKKKDMTTISILLELASILFFGMTLEIISVMLGRYTYPPFTFMFFGVPLIIGIGWSTIIFSAMWLTDSLKMPEWSRVFFDAFLALLIDLSMDAVAIRDIYTFDSITSGMWSWGIPFNAEWFGVPWFNFAGWWIIAFSMSTALRLTRKFAQKIDNSILKSFYPILAFFIALGFLFIFGDMARFDFNFIIFIIQMILSISIIIWKWRGIKNPISIKLDFPVYFVPLLFHISFIILMLINQYYVGALPILWMSIFVFILHVFILSYVSYLSMKKVK